MLPPHTPALAQPRPLKKFPVPIHTCVQTETAWHFLEETAGIGQTEQFAQRRRTEQEEKPRTDSAFPILEPLASPPCSPRSCASRSCYVFPLTFRNTSRRFLQRDRFSPCFIEESRENCFSGDTVISKHRTESSFPQSVLSKCSRVGSRRVRLALRTPPFCSPPRLCGSTVIPASCLTSRGSLLPLAAHAARACACVSVARVCEYVALACARLLIGGRLCM